MRTRTRITSIRVGNRIHVVEEREFGMVTKEWSATPTPTLRARVSADIHTVRQSKVRALRELFSHLQPSMECNEIVLVI